LAADLAADKVRKDAEWQEQKAAMEVKKRQEVWMYVCMYVCVCIVAGAEDCYGGEDVTQGVDVCMYVCMCVCVCECVCRCVGVYVYSSRRCV